MLVDQIVQRLEDNAAVFKSLLEPVPESQYRWKPSPEKWCLLEVICHLYDEEREDFRTRVRGVLEQPHNPLPAIDPVGWVSQRAYAQQDYAAKIRDFLSERVHSVQWLRDLDDPAWGNTNIHPQAGKRSAFFFLSNWLAHDYLHIRQINRLKYQYFETNCNNSLAYAGNW